ncbi:serine threonine- kinase Nek5 [Labeo rohita]|nr:serine threonine- kinase Nek5 [Labeo rohita]
MTENDQLQEQFNDLSDELKRVYKKGSLSGWFFITDVSKNWSESRQYCRNQGADLVMIKTEEKQVLINIPQKREFMNKLLCKFKVSEEENKILVKNENGDQFVIKKLSANQIVDWIVKICMALKHLYDQQILHKILKPEFSAILTVESVKKILTFSCEALPETFSDDLRQLVTDTLQIDPANRPSVSEILTRAFIINYLRDKSLSSDYMLGGCGCLVLMVIAMCFTLLVCALLVVFIILQHISITAERESQSKNYKEAVQVFNQTNSILQGTYSHLMTEINDLSDELKKAYQKGFGEKINQMITKEMKTVLNWCLQLLP